MSAEQPIDLSSRLALRQNELAAALGVSERSVRSIAAELPHVYVGSVPIYPVREVERWLSRRATDEEKRVRDLADEAVAEVLDAS